MIAPEPCPLCSSPARITGSVTYRDATGHRLVCGMCGHRFAAVAGGEPEARRVVSRKLFRKVRTK